MLTAQLRLVATSTSSVRLSAEYELRLGGSNSENVSEDVHPGQVSDEDMGFDTGERVGTFLMLAPPPRDDSTRFEA